MEPIKGCSFNAIRTSDNKLVLEWQTADPVNGRPANYRTVHEDYDSLVKQLRMTLVRASVVQ